jgi:inner membrane protein
MDSLTQFALGATVGAAVMGPRIGFRKAALAGGVLGTMPDLDVLWPGGGPVERFINHRSITHSLIVQALVTPLFAEGLRRLFAGLRESRTTAYLAVFLCFTTHALLDAMTVYGTQLFWPVWKEPLGLGSLFIIDPLYTLPLLAVTVWALLQGRWTPASRPGTAAALALSTLYAGWSVAAQQWALAGARELLAGRGVQAEDLMANPTPFNTLFWQVIALDGPRYHHIYLPMLGGRAAATSYTHPRWDAGLGCDGETVLAQVPDARRVADFADGFYRLDLVGDEVQIADLRMGLPGSYVFRFAVAEKDGRRLRPVATHRIRAERPLPGDLIWLQAGILGEGTVRLAERNAMVTAIAAAGGPAVGGTAKC